MKNHTVGILKYLTVQLYNCISSNTLFGELYEIHILHRAVIKKAIYGINTLALSLVIRENFQKNEGEKAHSLFPSCQITQQMFKIFHD